VQTTKKRARDEWGLQPSPLTESLEQAKMTIDCCVFKFLSSSVDGKHLMCFQGDNAVFKFLRRSVDGDLMSKASFPEEKKARVNILTKDNRALRAPVNNYIGNMTDLKYFMNCK